MTPQFNPCANLGTEEEIARIKDEMFNFLEQGINPLSVMLDMQKSLQVKLAQDKPESNMHPDELKTCGEILQWLKNQDDYIQDETRELYTALGGMSNPKPNAVWKPWRAEYTEYQNRLFTDLSKEDQLEVKFELIDIFHFTLNKFIALGMSSSDIFALYYLKNKENFERQKRQY